METGFDEVERVSMEWLIDVRSKARTSDVALFRKNRRRRSSWNVSLTNYIHFVKVIVLFPNSKPVAQEIYPRSMM